MVYFPHTLLIRRPEEGESTAVSYHDPESLDCQFTPQTKFGTVVFNPSGVQVTDPWLLMWSVDQPEACPVGTVLAYGGDWYVCVTPTQKFDAHPLAASCSCHFEKMQFIPDALSVMDKTVEGARLSGGKQVTSGSGTGVGGGGVGG